MNDLHKMVEELKQSLVAEDEEGEQKYDDNAYAPAFYSVDKADAEFILTLFKQWMDKYELALISRSEMETIKIDTTLAAKSLLSTFNPPDTMGWRPLTEYDKTGSRVRVARKKDCSKYNVIWWSGKNWNGWTADPHHGTAYENQNITDESEWEWYEPK